MIKGLRTLGEDPSAISERFRFDNSNAICLTYVIDQLATAKSGRVEGTDYLQLLDHKRNNPELATQVWSINEFVRDRGLIIDFISRIDRSCDPLANPLPGLAEVRLSTPLYRMLFYMTCFLNNGTIQVSAVN